MSDQERNYSSFLTFLIECDAVNKNATRHSHWHNKFQVNKSSTTAKIYTEIWWLAFKLDIFTSFTVCTRTVNKSTITEVLKVSNFLYSASSNN